MPTIYSGTARPSTTTTAQRQWNFSKAVLLVTIMTILSARTSVRAFLPSQRCRPSWIKSIFWPLFSTASDATSDTSVDDTSTSTPAQTAVKVPAKFTAFPFAYHQELDLTIERLTNRGWGIGRVVVVDDVTGEAESAENGEEKAAIDHSNNDDDDNDTTTTTTTTNSKKWVVMVPSVIPGERVRVRIFRNFAKYSEADLVRVLQESDQRRIPLCPLATEACGGCQLQHMTLQAQRDWKTNMVEEAMGEYNLLPLDEGVLQPCLGTDEEFAYRSKLTPHYQQPQRSRRGVANDDNSGNVKTIQAIGFQRKTSRALVDVDHCPIATPPINEAYRTVREELLANPPQKKKGATLLFRQGNVEDEYVETNHNNVITTKVNGLSFSYKAGNFFQNNYYVLPLMAEHVVKEATRGGGMTHLADCYCGSGLFAISAASHFDRVVGIEINDKAIAEATANAEGNHVTNCEFLAASAEHIFASLDNFPREQSAVVVDPPRKGCSEEFLQQLVAFGPARVVYMSCDPTTQARDAAVLVKDGGYRISTVLPFDLFPQTRHIECLMILDRQG